MTEIGFAPKEMIPPGVYRLEIIAADKVDTYGPQIALRQKVVGGQYDGYTFMDYANLDEDTGQVTQGSKAWSYFEVCLGPGFYKRPGVTLEDLLGKQLMGRVTQTKTGSRNKVEHGTIGPVPPEEANAASGPNGGSGDDGDIFADLPL